MRSAQGIAEQRRVNDLLRQCKERLQDSEACFLQRRENQLRQIAMTTGGQNATPLFAALILGLPPYAA